MSGWELTIFFFSLPFAFARSCWLSLEGGLLYAFVGPAAAVVLVRSSHLRVHFQLLGEQNKTVQLSVASMSSLQCAVILFRRY